MTLLVGLAMLVMPARATADACAFAPEAPRMCTEWITGVVVWPDGAPAGGMRIELVPHTRGVAVGTYATHADETTEVYTDVAGHYEASVCPCEALMGFLEVGERLSCLIVMGAVTPSTTDADFVSLRVYNGVRVIPGDQVAWVVGESPCRDRAAIPQPGTITAEWFGALNSSGLSQHAATHSLTGDPHR